MDNKKSLRRGSLLVFASDLQAVNNVNHLVFGNTFFGPYSTQSNSLDLGRINSRMYIMI